MTWRSYIPSNEIVTGTYNRWPRVPSDRQKGYVPRDYSQIPYGAYGATPFGDNELVPRDEWYERCQELERTKTRLSDWAKRAGFKIKNQNGIPYCWIFGVVAGCEIKRLAQGASEHIKLSPASTGCRITGYRSRGGWGDEACKGIEKWGLVPESMWPQAAINRRYSTDEAWEEADRYLLTDWSELPPRNLDSQVSCLLKSNAPCPSGYNHWSHLICNLDLVAFDKPNNTSDREMLRCFGIRHANSWSTNYGDGGYGILRGSKMVADGHVAIRSMRLTTNRDR